MSGREILERTTQWNAPVTDTLPCVYSADAHTLDKHRILEGYLKAWMPIITAQSARMGARRTVRYIDAFAGAGEYSNGEVGSPIVALNVALNHKKQFDSPLRLLFVEQRDDRFRHLSQLLQPLKTQVLASTNVKWTDPLNDDCEMILDNLLKSAEVGNEPFGPALVFLDQFGYSHVPIQLIRRIMRGSSCEVFSFMNWRDLNHYLSDVPKWPGITRAFGGEEWKEVMELPQSRKQTRLRELYEEALRSRAGVRYMCRFDMRDEHDKLLYWLFFCSNNIRGLEEMKRAMWHVDETGQFHFSDKHANHPQLLKGFDKEWLADALADEFRGQEHPLPEIVKHVLVSTPCYLYNDALADLESKGALALRGGPPERRRGSFKKYAYNPKVIVCFSN
jgi:three-Cys-motif partner protein